MEIVAVVAHVPCVLITINPLDRVLLKVALIFKCDVNALGLFMGSGIEQPLKDVHRLRVGFTPEGLLAHGDGAWEDDRAGEKVLHAVREAIHLYTRNFF